MSVEDQGCGLSAEERERIFERFMRMVTPDTDYPGSSLGLAICRSIVHLHGGEIFGEPGRDGRGLRVVVEIPTQIGTEAFERSALRAEGLWQRKSNVAAAERA